MRHGLGLRAQILIALSAAFVVAFTALSVVVTQLAQRANDVERARRAEATVEALAAGLGSGRAAQRERLQSFVGRAGIAGLALRAPGRAPLMLGLTQGKPDGASRLSDGQRLFIWLQRLDRRAATALGDMLRLYLFITAGAILLLAYVALTHLIVRPVEEATRAAERMTDGHLEIAVPVRGAAEVSRLAVSFNRMARELKADRQALDERVQELERTTLELESMQRQLVRSEKLASVGRLSAGVAHEIGNPLAAILGFVELLRTTELDADDQQEFLRRIQGETERIHHIIRDLLDFSRAAPDDDDLGTHCDVNEVVENAVKLVAPQKDLRNVTLERRLPDEMPAVRGSAERLTQVLLNLLLNAADAVGGEGDILIEVVPQADHAVLSVTDSGPGIAPEVLETLFDPFVTTKETGKGTGLGLSVCHAMMERAGGEIHAENGPGGGARFTLTLPFFEAGDAEAS